MKRYIYAFDSSDAARVAVQKLRDAGVADECIALVANSEIEMQQLPHERLDASQDFVPALERGAAIGGVTGLVCGLIAMAVPAIGITVGGAALLAFFASGALGAVIGAWSSALMGAAVPTKIRRRFEDEIKAGRVLLVVDSNAQNDAAVSALFNSGTDRHLLWQSEIFSSAA